MHPIERLRFVARARGLDDGLLAVEATAALMSFADQPAALVAACRRVLAQQSGCGPLWWACARLLTASEVWANARETILMLESDRTEAALSYALGEYETDRSGDGPPVAVHRARALGGASVLLCEPVIEWAEAGAGGQRWLVAGMGRVLSEPMWGALERALAPADGLQDEPILAELRDFTHVVGPLGPIPVEALPEPDCPVAPELFTLDG